MSPTNLVSRIAVIFKKIELNDRLTDKDIFHPLLCSPSNGDIELGARPQPGAARKTLWAPCGGWAPEVGPALAAFSRSSHRKCDHK